MHDGGEILHQNNGLDRTNGRPLLNENEARPPYLSNCADVVDDDAFAFVFLPTMTCTSSMADGYLTFITPPS